MQTLTSQASLRTPAEIEKSSIASLVEIICTAPAYTLAVCSSFTEPDFSDGRTISLSTIMRVDVDETFVVVVPSRQICSAEILD